MTTLRKEHLPWIMAAARALLGPVMILGERCGWSGVALASVVVTALASDIFDGVLARRWHCDTAGVRLFDSMADTIFYLSVGLALWIGQPQLWRDNAIFLGILLALEVVRFMVEFAKFGKPASYHSYLAKTWGLGMAVAVVGTFLLGHPSRLLPTALLLGIAADLEGLTMSLILPVWRKDVKTLAVGLRIRQELFYSGPSATPSRPRVIALLGTSLLVVLFSSVAAHALEPNQAVYIGGSAAVAPDTAGTLDTTSPAALVFRFKKSDGTAGEIGIDYASIRSVTPHSEVTHRLGVAPAIAVGLLAARQRRYFVTITWTDPGGIPEVVQMEVARRDQQPLVAVIHARMPRMCPAAAKPCIGSGNEIPATH